MVSVAGGAWGAAPWPLQPLTNPAEPDSGQSDEEALALLPRGTVVSIRGNARTRQSLLGQRAVVRRAVGLGGWHWLVLPSGEEVKLQRNALEVLERPTGNEVDMSEEEEEERRQQQQQAMVARGYIEPAEPHAEDRPRPPRRPPSVPPQPRPFEECGGGSRTRMHSRSSGGAGQPRINLGKLQTAALKRYSAVHHLPAAEQHQISREALLDAVAEHFAAQQVEESEVIACFLSAVKRHRMGLSR